MPLQSQRTRISEWKRDEPSSSRCLRDLSSVTCMKDHEPAEERASSSGAARDKETPLTAPEEGAVTVQHRRLFTVDASSFSRMREALYDTFLRGAPTLLYEMGLVYGTSLANEQRCVGNTEAQRAALFGMIKLTTEHGWGKATLIGDPAFGKTITLRVQNCVFCSGDRVRRKKSDSCYFLVGAAAGMVSTIFDWPYQAYEEKCGCRGDALCEIRLNEEYPLAKLKGQWGLSVLFPDLRRY
jgi:predicted hydrocarbon binding protein